MNQPQKNTPKKPMTAITPTREDDFAGWYQAVIKSADLAENSPVRGSMIVKPYGWALWENMQKTFDPWLKDYGVQNTAFPLLIPVSFLAKEAQHVEGFAKECAVVTHHRLEADGKGGLIPSSKAELEEPFVVRPTSETIIGDAMSRWIQSYRDLPLQLNQWGSVMRWEMRTRLFLRTSEFFWHEGHCAFEDDAGATKDCLTILDMYEKFFRDYLAFDGYKGVKTAEERFPGADQTYAFESIMQDGKALQAATTHNLGTNFAKSCGIKYQNRDGKETFAHTTSWAFSTRTIGALIMIHGDDDGMIMPPRIAPTQVMIIPVMKDDTQTSTILDFCDSLTRQLKSKGFSVKTDNRDMRSSDKMWDAVKKGIPVRIEVGAREVEQGQVTCVRRDLGKESKKTLAVHEFVETLPQILDQIHDSLLSKSTALKTAYTQNLKTLEDVKSFYHAEGKGCVKVPVSLLQDTGLEAIKETYSLTARVMPFEDEGQTVLLAKAY
ncbi:MAG: proline--tRNA ligase [Alphaproteobacteria bacterium]|nr:proline--tRNA ligase [Alphaproteobacteria bacterium]